MRFTVIDVPGSMKLPARSVFCMIAFPPRPEFLGIQLLNYQITQLLNFRIERHGLQNNERIRRSSPHNGLEALSDELFTLLPECVGISWVERVTANAFGCGVNRDVVRHQSADVAILAVLAADLFSRSNDSGPHRSCGALRDCLPLEWPFPLFGRLLGDPVNQRL